MTELCLNINPSSIKLLFIVYFTKTERGLDILTVILTVQVSAIAVGIAVGAIVTVAIGNGKDLRGCSHCGQNSQQGDKKNKLKHTRH